MNFSSQHSQYPYPASQSYAPSRFQAYDRQFYYSNYQYQQNPHLQKQQPPQQQYQQPQQQYQQPQQQYSSYYTPNYSNSYPQQHPQTNQQWHRQEPPIHPPGVSSQPSSASHGQAHFQLPNQQSAYHLPQRTDGVGLGLNPEAVVAVAELVQFAQLAGSVGAAERLTGGLQGQSWYPQAQGFGPVIGGPGAYTGPGLGSGAFPGHGPGPSGLLSHAGQSLDRGGGRRGGGQRKGGGRGKTKRDRLMTKNYPEPSPIDSKFSNSAGVVRCELCKVDCGGMDIRKQHESGKWHKMNLKKLEANENRTVSDFQNVQKPSGDLKPGTTMKPVSREILKKKKVSKAKRLVIGPSNPKVVLHLMCDLCNVKCDTREILRQHLLGRNHKSQLKCFEGHHPIYGRLGLQALYPPNPVTKSLYHSQVARQVLNGAQVSDPIAGASLLPQNGNAAPSTTG